jgi:hypothetical protein
MSDNANVVNPTGMHPGSIYHVSACFPGRPLGELRGKKFRLQFSLRAARLYAFDAY